MFAWTTLWCFIFGIAVLVHVECALTVEQMNKAAVSFRNACVSKVGTDTELVEGIRKGQFPDDEKLKCYTKCIMARLKTYRDGQIDLDMLLRQINMMMAADIAPRMSEAAKICAPEAKGDSCEATFNFVKCNYNADPEVFFFP